jgi:hypothetical protein
VEKGSKRGLTILVRADTKYFVVVNRRQQKQGEKTKKSTPNIL